MVERFGSKIILIFILIILHSYILTSSSIEYYGVFEE